MNNFKVVSTLLSGALLLTLAGCGGGGGDTPPPSTAVVRLSTATATPLAGVQVNLPIPEGTSVATAAGVIQPGVIVPSGVLAGGKGSVDLSFASYSAPTAQKKGSLKFIVISADNTSFIAGEFATVTCSFRGVAPKKTDFDTLLLQATDIGGNTVSVGETFTLSIL